MREQVTRVFLVRHGETEWNAGRTFQGQQDSRLTSRGLRQAAELADRLAGEGVEFIYSSDLGRAANTARVVGERLGLAVSLAPMLREIDCGLWTGLSYDEVAARWPEEFDNWRTRPHLHRMPGGESVAEVQQRGMAFLEEARRRHPGSTTCLVTHNTIVKTVLSGLQGQPLSQLWEGVHQVNCAVNLVEYRGNEPVIVEICSIFHLSELGSGGISIV